MIPYAAVAHDAVAHDATCGVRCIDCGERMCAWFGPEPAPRCPDCPTCVDCADVVTCPECAEVLAAREQDRREQAEFDSWREVCS